MLITVFYFYVCEEDERTTSETGQFDTTSQLTTASKITIDLNVILSDILSTKPENCEIYYRSVFLWDHIRLYLPYSCQNADCVHQCADGIFLKRLLISELPPS